MTQFEANEKMVEKFEELNRRADQAETDSEYMALVDGCHKLYITLTNSGAFGATSYDASGNGFGN